MTGKLLNEVYVWTKTIILAMLVSIIINVFFFQPFKVSGSSMEPTLQGEDQLDQEKIGDRLLIFKSSYTLGNDPEHGDMVIIDSRIARERTLKDDFTESPIVGIITQQKNNDRNLWIKRVIGIEGDLLEFQGQQLYRNGVLVEEDYIKEEMNPQFDSIVVPENHVFVMGDNRNYSSDSREIGPVPVENIVGQVMFRYFPFQKLTTY